MKTSHLSILIGFGLIGTVLASAASAAVVGRTGGTGGGSPSSAGGPPPSQHVESVVISNPPCAPGVRIACVPLPRFKVMAQALEACVRNDWEDGKPGFILDKQFICTHRHLTPVNN